MERLVVVISEQGKEALEHMKLCNVAEAASVIADLNVRYPFPNYKLSVLSENENPSLALGNSLGQQVRDLRGPGEAPAELPEEVAHSVRDGAKVYTKEFEIPQGELSDERVIECLRTFGPNQFVVSGEFNYRVYTPRFLQTLSDELHSARQIYSPYDLPFQTRIVCGPIALIPDDYRRGRKSKESILPELVDMHNVEVYSSDHRQLEHFRYAYPGVHYEYPHGPNSYQTLANDGTVIKEGRRTAVASLYDRRVLNSYRLKRDQILTEDSAVKKVMDVEEQFLFLTEQELKKLVNHVDVKGSCFENVGRDTLREYCKELGIETN